MTDSTDRTNGANQVLASIPFAVLVHRDGKIVFANTLAVTMHHAGSPEQIVGRDPFALVHPDYHARILARREVAQDGESFEHKRLRIDGSEFIAKTRTSQFLWEGARATLVVIRDTTQSSKNRDALQESERRYRELIDGSTFGIQISRLNGERLFVNRKFVEMFGYDSAEEMLGITEPGALIAPHDRERIVANRVARAAGQPAPEYYEYDALRKDGSFLAVQAFFRRVYWEGEAAIQRTMIDITARREAEQAQRESEERYRHLAELLPDGILINTDGIVVYANDSLARILAVESPDDLIGTQAIEMIPPQYREEVMARRKLACEGKPVAMAEGMYLRRDGSLTHVDRVVRQIIWQGKPSMLVLVRDISERKRVDAALQEQRVLLETVMNCMDPTLAAWDKDLKLIAWNRRWEVERKFPDGFLRTGLDYEVVQRWSYQTGRFKSDDMEASIARRLIYVRQGIEPEPIVERPDGTIILRKRHPLPDGGFVTTRIDITELRTAQKRIEEQTRELKKMAEKSEQAMRDAQSANQAKSEFLALMSHELRTPLNAVLGFSEIISTEAIGPLGANKYGEYARDIYNSGQHLLELINDILDLSKVESGKDEIYEEEIRVEDLVSQLMPLVRGRAERGRVVLRSDCTDDQHLLLADKRKLKQILVNVLSNAIKFSAEGGQVVLNARYLPESGYIFQVVDNGIGIAPEDISRALSPFQQVESELNRKIEGTGLGLPLSKALVELHGGSLDLQSEVGVGTTVTLRFPLERVVMPKTATPPGLRRLA